MNELFTRADIKFDWMFQDGDDAKSATYEYRPKLRSSPLGRTDLIISTVLTLVWGRFGEIASNVRQIWWVTSWLPITCCPLAEWCRLLWRSSSLSYTASASKVLRTVRYTRPNCRLTNGKLSSVFSLGHALILRTGVYHTSLCVNIQTWKLWHLRRQLIKICTIANGTKQTHRCKYFLAGDANWRP
jgi:hypothetical protein